MKFVRRRDIKRYDLNEMDQQKKMELFEKKLLLSLSYP